MLNFDAAHNVLTLLGWNAVERYLRLHHAQVVSMFRRSQPSQSIMKSILDPSFQYTPSVETDLRKTFARIRKELRKSQKAAAIPTNVQPLRRERLPRLKLTG